MVWNANAPNVLGVEWLPERLEPFNLNTDAGAIALGFTAAATRNITDLWAAMSVSQAGQFAIELYTEANYLLAATDAITSDWYPPTADYAIAGATIVGGGAAPYYQHNVGQCGSAPNASYLQLNAMGTNYIGYRFGGVTVAAGRRVLQFRCTVDREVFRITQPPYVGITAYEQGFSDSPPASVREMATFTINDRFGRQVVSWPWRPSRTTHPMGAVTTEVASWNAAPADFGFFWFLSGAADTYLRCYHVNLVVDHVVERRLAWGVGNAYSPTSPYTPTPAGQHGIQTTVGPTTTKTVTSGTRYVLVLRRLPAIQSSPELNTQVVAQVLQWKPGPPHTGYTGGPIPLDSYGRAGGVVVPTTSAGIPIVTGVAGTMDLLDTMPFYDWALCEVNASLFPRQKFTTTTAATYGQLLVPLARGEGATIGSSTTLTARIRRTSDDVQMGGLATITGPEWDALPGGYLVGGRLIKNCRLAMASTAALAATTAYYIELTATYPAIQVKPPNLSPEYRWPPPAWAVPFEGGMGTYSGFEQFAFVIPGSPYIHKDSGMLAVVVPTVPAGFAAVVATETLPSADGTGVNVGAWDYASLTWTATSIGAGFARYEIQRQEAGGAWLDVAWITTEATAAWRDREGRRGRAASYRMRVVRLDTAASAWSATIAVTPTVRCCGLGLVTNSSLVPSLFFQDIEALRTYTLLDAAGVVVRQLYAADYQAVFRPTEQRGVRLAAHVLVYYGQPLGTGITDGLQRFDALRALARAQLPYVAVCDEEGTRVLAALTVPEASLRPQGHVYYAAIEAVQVAADPIKVVA